MNATDVKYAELIDYALKTKGSLGATYNRFYNYSFFNMLLLAHQGVQEPVATYKGWSKLERQVKKGSKAKTICQPIVGKDEDGEVEIKGFSFRNCIFSLSDTDGEELPTPESPNWNLEDACEKLKVEEVKFSHINGNIQGYSFKRKFAINPLAEYKLKTTFHELAHILLGHTDEEAEDKHRGVCEFQAEATAYLVMKELGEMDEMDDSESRAYIQGWLKETTPEDKDIRQVFSTVNKILTAGVKNKKGSK